MSEVALYPVRISHRLHTNASRLSQHKWKFPIKEQLFYKKVHWFRGGLVFKAHRLFNQSTPGLRVMKKRKNFISRRTVRPSRSPARPAGRCLAPPSPDTTGYLFLHLVEQVISVKSNPASDHEPRISQRFLQQDSP